MLKESQRRARAETSEDIPHVGGIEGRLKLKTTDNEVGGL